MTHSILHRARILTVSILRLVCAVAVAASPGGCGRSDVTPKAELIDDTAAALGVDSLTSVDGTYTNCIERTGSWSLATQVGATLDNPPLSVVQGDPACALAVTALNTASTTYVTSKPIALGSSWQSPASPFSTTGSSPWLFDANAMMSPPDFSTDFTVTVLYSDDSNLVTPTENDASFASVTSSATAEGVPSPDYTLTDDITVTTDLSNNVVSATGSIDLTFVTQGGEDYVVDMDTLPSSPTYDDITDVYSGSTMLSGSPPSVPASAFDLTGALPLIRNLIIRHTVAGVSSYEAFRITFEQVQLLPNGATCGADSECSSTFCCASVCCPGGTVFQGSAMGDFTTTDTVESAPGSSVVFAPGSTLWAVLQVTGSVSHGVGEVVASYDTAGYHGWALELPSTNAIWLLSDTRELRTTAVLPPGISAVCLVWHAGDNSFDLTLNGVSQQSVGAATPPSAPSGTWATFLGGPPGPLAGARQPFAGRILAAATWATEATEAQCQAGTYTSGNRFSLPSSVTSSAVLDFEAARDFDAAGFASGGSSPVTFAVSGSPALTPVAEIRYPWQSLETYFYDGNAFAEARSDASTAWVTHAPYTHLRVQTDAGSVYAEAYTLETWATHEQVSAYLGGTFDAQVQYDAATYPQSPHSPALAAFGAAEHAGNIWDIWDGGCDTNDYITQPYDPVYGGRWCTAVNAVRLPIVLQDGVTPAHSSILSPPSPPAHRVVLLGEALLDWNASAPAQTSVPGLLRQSYPYPADGITFIGGASLAMAEFAARANSIPSVVASLDGTSTNTVWVELMRGDAYGPVGDAPAAFTGYYTSVLNGICAGKPGTVFYLQGAVQIPAAAGGEWTNGYGADLDAYRAAASTIASGSCPSACSCVYLDCAAGACVHDSSYGFDSAFLTDAGLAQYEGVIATTLSGAGLL